MVREGEGVMSEATARRRAVPLTHHIAQRIVDRVMENLDRNVNVIGADAHILASGDRSRVGGYHPIAAAVLRDGQMREITPDDARVHEHVRPGVAAPLHFEGERVGVIVVNGETARARDSVGIVAALAELLLYQELVIERMPDHARATDNFIAALVHDPSEDDAAVLRRAQVLGIDLTAPRRAVVFEIQAAVEAGNQGRLPVLSAGAAARQRRLRYMRAIRAVLHWEAETPLAVLDEARLVALPRIAPRRERDETGAAHELAASLEAALALLRERLNAEVYVGIGRYHAGLAGLAASYGDAIQALRIGRRVSPRRRAYLLDELGAAAFVGPLDGETKAALARRLLEPLMGHDELMQTLEAYLESGLSSSATIERLSMHRNTLGYRLGRIHDLVGLDPRRFDDAFLLRLALLARDLYA